MSEPGPELPPHVRVLQMMMGHWVAQVLATVAELGVADQIAKGLRTSDEIAAATKASPDGLSRLMRAAAAVGILEQGSDGRFSLTAMGDCLRSDAPLGLRDLIVAELAPGHWLPWGRLAESVRTGKPQSEAALGMDTWTYYEKNPAECAWFARGMGNLSTIAAAEVTAAYDFKSFGTIVDVGGSQGALISSVLKATPNSRGILLDRPEVIAEGATMVKSYGLGDRLKTETGDFFEKVPVADAYLVKSILHDWNDERSVAILKSIAHSAKPGAKLLIVEMLLSDSPMATPIKLMDLNMMVMLGGRERTAEQYGTLMAAAGFRFERAVPTHGLFSVVEGVRT